MKLIFVLCLVLTIFALKAENDIFLGENHEYGHIPIDNKEPKYQIFYWLFKNRAKNLNPPLVIWIEGGPGCSCQQSLFLEHGPYRLLPNSSDYISSPYSWNNIADVLYTDQPLGTGLSNCSDISRIPTNADEMAADFYGFFMNFLDTHSEYRSRVTTVYFAGHSFAGHFIPAIVKLLIEKKFSYKIGGILLGNPFTNPHALAWSYPNFAYTNELITSMRYTASRVARYLYEFFDNLNMKEVALMFFKLTRGISAGLYTVVINQADIRNITMPVQYFERAMYTKILKKLKMENLNWANCNPIIKEYSMNLEHITDYTPYIEYLLDKKVTILFYYGDKDFICSIDSWKYMNNIMKWWGKSDFEQSENHLWLVNGKVKGEYKFFGNLGYYKVYNAGHIVFFNEPEGGLDLISRLINMNNY